jgi:chorismate-pyruvate lyase
MPQPYRELLVHHNDMTPTLEAYHSGTIYIERLHSMDGESESSREVILLIEGTDKPVEYGASRVFLEKLTPDARELFFDGHTPLGTILRRCGNRHSHSPSGFFRLAPSPLFEEIFGVGTEESLYGRRNTLLAPDGEPLAEVCEIMPPKELVKKGGI